MQRAHDPRESGLRVLQVLPSIVPGGGSEQSLAMVAPLLRARGIDLHMAYLDRGGELVDHLRDQGVMVHDLSGAPRVYPDWARRIRGVVCTVRPRVVHSTLFDADISTRLATPFTRTRLLSTWANTSFDPVRKRLEPGYGGWKREVVRWIDMVTAHATRTWFHAVTEGVADDGVRGLHVSRRRVYVVERGRDLSKFAPASPGHRSEVRRLIGVGDGEVLLINVARQFHQKGHVHLLRAFEALAADRPALRLAMVGPGGPATSTVEAQLSVMHHRDRVIELGQRTDVADLLAAADVFVLSSVAEGAAGSLLEAMATGVPVVATRIEGLRGWVEDGEHAVLAEPGSAVDLARAIRVVLDGPDAASQRARRAQRQVVERFSLERCADNMARMYQRMNTA